MSNNLDDAVGLPVKPKILLHLRSVADAPALTKKKFKLDSSKCLIEVETFLRKQLKHSGSLVI